MYYTDYICRNKFRNICDVECRSIKDFDKILDKSCIIYYLPQILLQLFDYISKLSHEYILVSRSTRCFTKDLYDKIPDNVVKVFCENLEIPTQINLPKVTCIPIGIDTHSLNNRRWKIAKYIPEYASKFLNKEKLLYINYKVYSKSKVKRIQQHHVDLYSQRLKPYKLFADINNWYTIQQKTDDYISYITNIKKHYFVLCPCGGGLDTHRFWETLYLGSYPIVIKNCHNILFADLPICYVNKWEDVTEDFLNKELDRLSSIYWNTERLYFNYWQNLIEKTKWAFTNV